MNSVTPSGKAAAAANLKPFATVTHPVALQNDKHTNSEQQEHTHSEQQEQTGAQCLYCLRKI